MEKLSIRVRIAIVFGVFFLSISFLHAQKKDKTVKNAYLWTVNQQTPAETHVLLENDLVRVEIDAVFGRISRIFDKQSGIELASPSVSGVVPWPF